jgi:multicomponent K+:H+ antiporter subunit C
MEALVASAVGVMTAAGIYLMLQRRSFSVIIGLTLITYAVNVFLLTMGRLTMGRAPIYGQSGGVYPDPLPQALVLTAIVISFGMTALIVVLALRGYLERGDDTVDARQSEDGADAP